MVHFDIGVHAQVTFDHIPIRMLLGFVWCQTAHVNGLLRPTMVKREQMGFAVADQISTAITRMGEKEDVILNRRRHNRCPHPLQGRALLGFLINSVIRTLDSFFQPFRERQGFFTHKHLHHRVDGNLAGFLAACMPPDPIRNHCDLDGLAQGAIRSRRVTRLEQGVAVFIIFAAAPFMGGVANVELTIRCLDNIWIGHFPSSVHPLVACHQAH